MENQTKPKIIYAWNYVEWGGAQIYYLALIKEVKKEFDVKIVCPENSDEQLLRFIRALDIDVEFVQTLADNQPAAGLKRKLERHLNKIKSEGALLDYLEKMDLKNSILHIELSPWQSLFSLAKLAQKTRVFITAHNSLPPVPPLRKVIWRAKLKIIEKFKNFYLFCSNEDSKNYFRQYFSAKFVEEKISVTYTSVNPLEIDEALAVRFDENELKQKFDIPKDKFLIVCVGQFIDRKGRWTFLEAARTICKTRDDVAFVWISNSKPTAEDLKKADDYGLGRNFRLITSDQIGGGRIDLFKIFRLADVYVLASFVEGLPISLLEAMALGIPSVSTNVNAIPEAVKNLDTGILIEAGDDKKLAESILLLKSDEKLCEKLSKNGREWVLKNFDEREVAKIAIAAYKKSQGLL